tara:strand:+ start:5500 stop:5760 length:261 start_codon:yes stop_codon:yes gene_type:complete
MSSNIEIDFFKPIYDDIDYYKDYQSKLCQFIIINCCYAKAYSSKKNYDNKIKNRLHITPPEMISLLKEILWLEVVIYKLKLKINKI